MAVSAKCWSKALTSPVIGLEPKFSPQIKMASVREPNVISMLDS
jgi:hypothetical protein